MSQQEYEAEVMESLPEDFLLEVNHHGSYSTVYTLFTPWLANFCFNDHYVRMLSPCCNATLGYNTRPDSLEALAPWCPRCDKLYPLLSGVKETVPWAEVTPWIHELLAAQGMEPLAVIVEANVLIELEAIAK